MSSKAVATVLTGLMLTGWAAATGVAAAYPSPSPSPAPSPSSAPSPSPAASQSPAASPGPGPSSSTSPPGPPKTTIDHDGVFAVGTDIVPGIYTSAGPVGNGTCYWKRMSNPDGQLIDNSMSKKPQVVQIDANDKAFKTTGCQPWQLTPDATPPPQLPAPLAGAQLGILNGLLAPPNGQQAPQPSSPPSGQTGPLPGPPPSSAQPGPQS